MELIDIYHEFTYIGSFEKTDENIINYVASIPPYKNILLVDYYDWQFLRLCSRSRMVTKKFISFD